MNGEPSLMDLACDERTDLAAFLSTLTPDEWHAESLCTGWTMKDVVVHVISYEELKLPGLLKMLREGAGHARQRGRSGRVLDHADR